MRAMGCGSLYCRAVRAFALRRSSSFAPVHRTRPYAVTSFRDDPHTLPLLLWRRHIHTGNLTVVSDAVPEHAAVSAGAVASLRTPLAAGAAEPRAVPSAVEFNEHLFRQLLEGDADGSSRVLEVMREYRIDVDTRCDSIMRMDLTDLVRLRTSHLKGLVDDVTKVASFEQSLVFFEALCANGVAHVEHLNAVLLTCVHKHQQWQLIRRAWREGHVVPTAATYNVLLNGALFEGDHAEVKNVINCMIESEISPTNNTKRLLELQPDELSRMRTARLHSIIDSSEQPWSTRVKRARACFDRLAENGAVNAYQLAAILLTCPTSDEMLALIGLWENRIDLSLPEKSSASASNGHPLSLAADRPLPDTPLRIVFRQLMLEGDAAGISKLLERFGDAVKLSVDDVEKRKSLTSHHELAKHRTSSLERLLHRAGTGAFLHTSLLDKSLALPSLL